MPAPHPRERHAHRQRWRPVPDPRNRPPDGSSAPADRLPQPEDRRLSQGGTTGVGPPAIDFGALRLPQLFSPAQAAQILRSLGLTGMTETALRSRAYRRQVPFHLNGRKITFTESDLKEIAEGRPLRPEEPDAPPPRPTAPSQPQRRAPRRSGEQPEAAWRARPPTSKPPVQGPT
jgi:hypothetical protein